MKDTERYLYHAIGVDTLKTEAVKLNIAKLVNVPTSL